MSNAFPGQREGEEVELIFRRHGLTAWRGWIWMIFWMVIGTAPMFVQYGIAGGVAKWFANDWWRDFTEVVGQNPTLFYIWLGCFVIGVIGMIHVYVMRYFSYYLVTNQRVRQVRQKGFFKKTVVDLGLDKIQSISYEIPGIFGGILGFGTLLLQTQVGNMRIGMVKKPEKIYNILQDLVEKVAK